MSEVINAAGAVVWRPALPGPEVLLVHRVRYDDWLLPKGKREPGEHPLLTVVREVFEETSVRPVLGPRLQTTEYLANGAPKRVDYWSARCPGQAAVPSHEVDAVSWLPLCQAVGRLSYPHDASVLSCLDARDTVPLILVRHASAGRKADWPCDDDARPLDARGTSDALTLAGLLACFAPRARVISSPTLRCTQTVLPYAAGFGGTVETEAALAVSGRSGSLPLARTSSGETVGSLIRGLVAARRPAVVCLHRENLPPALAAACSALGAALSQAADAYAVNGALSTALPKGGFWVVHAAGGELAGLECYEPS